MTPREIDDAIGAPPWIDLYQVVQQREGRVVVSFVGDDSHTAAQVEELRGPLTELLAGREVRCQRVKYLPCERGGKFQVCRGREIDPS